MSKEAVGQFNTKIGSSEYWSRLNRSTLLGSLMDSKTDYQSTLRQLGERASEAIEEIYEDLSQLASKIRFLPSDHRNSLAKQVEGLYDICRMAGVSAWHNSECVQGLNLSIMSPWTSSFRDEWGIERAISIINRFPYSGSEAVDLLQDAAKWSISSAAGYDPEKLAFLEAVEQGKGSSFLQDVAEEYEHQTNRPGYEGSCGHTVGSDSYLAYMETKVFGTSVSGFGDPDYERLLKDALRSIAEQLEQDLDNAIRENDYITDETADSLKAAVGELDHCGVSTGSLNNKIDKLAWFVGGDPAKIRRLQQALNKLGYGLTEDGVFGAKTLDAMNCLHNDLSRGTYPILAWVDPLQGKTTGIKLRGHTSSSKKYGDVSFGAFEDFSARSQNIKNGINNGVSVFRFDYEDEIGYHINTVRGDQIDKIYFPDSDKQREIINSLNHKTVDERTYKILKNFDRHTKTIRIGSKVLAITGAVLDALEIWETFQIDKHDADGKIGKMTWSAGASIVGSWSLGTLGTKGGAMIGASIGTAILPGVGTAVGGAVGGLVLGIVGSYSGSKLGECVIDITMTE